MVEALNTEGVKWAGDFIEANPNPTTITVEQAKESAKIFARIRKVQCDKEGIMVVTPTEKFSLAGLYDEALRQSENFDYTFLGQVLCNDGGELFEMGSESGNDEQRNAGLVILNLGLLLLEEPKTAANN